MKKIVITLTILASFAVHALAYDFQSGNLLYTIISTDPLCVSLSGHVDNTNAQGELVIPETVEYEGVNYSVTDIGYRAFYQCNLLSGDLVIPNTVTHISLEAFTGCTGFTGSLVIPNNMIELGTDVSMATSWDGVFQGCSGFAHLVLGESVQKIGYSCFFGCSGFTGPLLLPNGILEIWDSAFAGCLGFNGELVLPSSLTQIGKEAFMDCANLTGTLAIPETIATVGYGAFSGCGGIENIVLPSHYVFDGNGLGNPGDYVFSGCTSLTSIEIPDGWEKTAKGTFSRCSNLRSVRLPQSLKEIGQSCFEHCTNLSDIHIPERVTKINAFAFSHCSNLTEFDFPDSLTLIGSGAFRYCTGLSGVMRIPDPVEQINVFAFDSCVGITSVVLGPSLNRIDEPAFENTMLKSIILKATTPPALIRSSNESAWHFPVDIPITVPCGTLEAYQNADGWAEFTNMNEGPAVLLSVVSENENYGTVSIHKEATCEDMGVEVEALPNEGYTFLYWEVNGTQVANENPYSFELEDDTELIARFSGVGLDEMFQTVYFYPNPTTDLITVKGKDLKAAEVVNALGQRVATTKGQGEQLTLDISSLPAGIYFVNVIDNEGRKCVRKVVKE